MSGVGVDPLTCEPDDDLVLMADLRESTNLVSKASSNCFVRFLWGKQADSVRGSDTVKFIEDTRNVTTEEALKKAVKKESSREVLSITFHPSLPSVHKIVKKL